MQSCTSGVEEMELRSSVETVERKASTRSEATARMELFEPAGNNSQHEPLLSSADMPLTMDDVDGSRRDEDVSVAVQRGNSCCDWVREYIGKGEISTLVAFIIMIVGIVLSLARNINHNSQEFHLYRCIRALGLFAFSGGVTNWLAVKMLFDKIPGLVGSGVVVRRFEEIRETVKQVVLDSIFDAEAMQEYIDQKTGAFLTNFNMEEHIQTLLESETVDRVIDKKLADLMARPEGLLLAMMGIDIPKLKKLVKPFVFGLGMELAPMLVRMLDSLEVVNGYRIREQVEAMMTDRLQEFTPAKVKELVERMMRKHLGWLVIWGNMLGAVFGLVTELISIYA